MNYLIKIFSNNQIILFQNCTLVVREQHPERPGTWTGPGFVRVYEDTDLTFTIDNVPKSMNYDVVLRYTPQQKGDWEDVRISLIRPDGVEVDSMCYNVNPNEEREKHIRLYDYETSVVALHNLCLEDGKIYKFIVSFQRQSQRESNPSAQILIDSVIFLPYHFHFYIEGIFNFFF